MTTSIKPTPVTLITGFLGAGKTTLLNNILHAEHGLRVAVMVNDFGAVNIDAQLIVGVTGEETVKLSNGCICCTIRGDLLREALALVNRSDAPEYIVVEASGVADPASIVTTFAVEQAQAYFQIDSVITVVDVEQALSHLLSREVTRKKVGAKIEDFLYTFFPSKQAELYETQIRTADLVILNKVDLLNEEALHSVHTWIKEISPRARHFESTFGKIPLELALGVGRFDPAQINFEAQDVHVHETGENPNHHHDHDHSLVFETWSFTSEQPFELRKLREALSTLPLEIYRAKGTVYLAEYPNARDVLHVVGRRIQLRVGEAWRPDETPHSQIVLIGAHGNVDAAELEKRFTAALIHGATPQTQPTFSTSLVEWVRTKLN